MQKSQFHYATYIKTTPDKLWRALTEPEFIRQYFFGTTWECEWNVGSAWRMIMSDGRVSDAGKVLEIDPPRRLVLSWRSEHRPEMHAEGFARMIYELEPQGGMVKFTVRHESDTSDSKLIASVSGGWPLILASVKSLLETGAALPDTGPSGKAGCSK